ncbi:acetylxylan esterase [Streptococcus merionis]|uniref:acetylxylan esterase n=1 Tax=Streptococcus merionis TaxID=400065 RepID=UPI0026ED3BDA|nr:acetylxylan esterase [Streptococcus merionis]
MRVKDAVAFWGDYRGSQCKPADFDVFWARALEEVDQLGFDYQLRPASFTSPIAECFELIFSTVNGSTIVCQLLKPKVIIDKCPVLFQFHGYHTNVGDWSDKLTFVALGYIVVAMDVPGQGGASQDYSQTSGGTLKGHLIRGVEDGPENLFYKQVYQAIYQLTRIVASMTEVNSQRFYSYGVSQGGALALVCASLCSQVRVCFVQYPFLSDFREAYGLQAEQSAYEELPYYFRFRDPLHEMEETIFKTLDYIDIQYLVPQIKAKVFWGMALEDRICHPKTQFAVYNQLQTEKELLFYPEFGHEYLPKFNDMMHQKLSAEGEDDEAISS